MHQSTRNLEHQEGEHPRIKFKRSSTRIKFNELNQIQNQGCLLSKILCLHHIRIAFRYLCDINNNNIVKYNDDYESFLESTTLRDIVVQNKSKGRESNILWQAFKLERWAILVIVMLSLATAAASVVIIYYQQTLAKYIITQTQPEQYKWFGIIVGTIVARFLLFNYSMALTNNVAINIKVGLENLFMRAVFFLDNGGQELNMHRMKYLAIQSLIEAISFFPYSLVALCTIIGVAVLIFVLNNYYGFVFFGIFFFFLIVHIIILILVYRKLRKNEQTKDQIAQESKWVFRSLLPLIFDRISQKIVNKIVEMKNKSLLSDRFYNFSYTLSQFLSDLVPVASIIVYYGLNHDGVKTMTIQNTFFTAGYLGMLYYPFKIYVYGCFAIIRGFQQYQSMVDNFRHHFKMEQMSDLHLPLSKPNIHSYPDNVGECFHYQYKPNTKQHQQQQQPHLPSLQMLKKNSSNVFMHLQPSPGETVMAYFTTGKNNQVERYIKELISALPIETTVAVIHQNPFVLPESFQQNIVFYSEYNQQKFHQILRLVELDYFIPQIEAIGDNPLSYRISKYYAWHECRLQLARALYNSVDYLIISKYIIIEDVKLLTAVINYRTKQGKITYVANNWHFNIFHLAHKVIFFDQDRVEAGTLDHMLSQENSIINNIKKKLKKEGAHIERSEEITVLHQNFLTLITKKPQPIELERKIYLQFFGFAHLGGALVVLIAMAAPIGFKIYVGWLIGQSTLPKVVIYPKIITFGVLYLVFVFIRGIILSFYFRLSSFELFKNIVKSHRQLCGDQILSVYKEKDDRIENDFKKVDSNLVICFELGISVIIESFASLILIGIGQPIVLVMAVPLVVILAIVNGLYNRIERKLLSLRERYEEQLKMFVNHCTTRALTLFKYGKFEQIQSRFLEMHRMHIMFACNQMWVLSGMRIIGQILIIIAVVIFLVIMIETQSNKLTNLPMVAYGVSLFLNMSFSYRFNLKTFSIIEAQMLSLTKCIDFFKKIDLKSKDQAYKSVLVEVTQLQSIQFKDISIQFGANSCSNINLQFKRGDRVAVSTDSKSLVTLPFYLLKKQAFSKEHVKGTIIINAVQMDNFNIVGLYYIHSKPLLPSKGTIFDLCLTWRPDLLKAQCVQLLEQFFKEVDLQPIFTIETQLSTIHIAYQQILSVFRAVKFQNCQLLILVSAFDYLDILTRIKIEKYLISLKSIQIIINITNNPQITHLYKRHIIFKKERFTEHEPNDEVAREGESKKDL